ncbi:hypothetical protein [Undibacterium crateris]|uniref:hypothetical protein n=1 Tax=Undibacterium crateris TaxID=2528175 RepID=UPI001389E9F2|nr:hypothetical protein [Undibacterium crateris]NDI85044.1 hypothetical protein [Undibacterium crateris]
MTPIELKPYGAGHPHYVLAERILSWHLIDYNGRHGTCIVLDNGKEMNCGNWPREIAAAIENLKAGTA